jgi:hypothetical protein
MADKAMTENGMILKTEPTIHSGVNGRQEMKPAFFMDFSEVQPMSA